MSRLIRKELKFGKKIPFYKKLWCWQKGFFSSSYILYDLSNNNYKNYLSDYAENIRAIRLNDEHFNLLDDKISFSNLISPELCVPVDIAKLSEGKITQLSNKYSVDKSEDLLKILSEERELILKPIDSAAGTGVLKIGWEEGKISYNSKKISEKDFLEQVKKLNNYLVSLIIKQAYYSDKIYSRTVNTIRILTMISPDDGIPFIAAAAHRFGTDRSFPVDNCNAGGLTSNIDIETGVMGGAVSTYFEGNELHWMNNHPNTGILIKEVQIPGWVSIKNKILQVAAKISFLKYIGWDIVVTESGFVVLEGNNGPDIKLHQVHKPLLNNPEVKNFFEFYGIVR